MHEHIRTNHRRSLVVVAGFSAFVAVVAAGLVVLAGSSVTTLVIAAVGVAAVVAAAYRFSDRIVLSISRVRPADDGEHARLHSLTESLCMTVGLAKPDLYVIDDAAPNAFTVGRDAQHASMVVTTGLVTTMDRVELEAIVAHELAHVKCGDTRLGTVAAVMLGWPMLIADLAVRARWWNGGRVPRHGDRPERSNPVAWIGVALRIAAPLSGTLMRMADDPQRESLADVEGCRITRYPPGMVSAFEKLDSATTVTHAASSATAHLWIGQPLSGIGDSGRFASVHRWFGHHPSLDERIALLREL